MAKEYLCLSCSHRFPWSASDDHAVTCPRCGMGEVEPNPWLLGRGGAEGLTDEDHYFAGLAV